MTQTYATDAVVALPDDVWCILRCQGRSTFRLVKALADQGYVAWTPQTFRRIRIPRFNVRTEAVLPLLPTYVFAKADCLSDLLELAKVTYPRFSIMRHQGMIPLVEDANLDGLRSLETKPPPTKANHSIPVAAYVSMADGVFGGMKGRVEWS